jgi:hypothetical protein
MEAAETPATLMKLQYVLFIPFDETAIYMAKSEL